MIKPTNKGIDEILSRPELIVEAVRRGVRQAVREHKLLGLPMVGWENGRVVEIPADQLPDPDTELAAPETPADSPDAVP